MGLPLRDFIKPVVKPIKIEDLRGKIVGIDTYNYLYSYLMAIRATSGIPLEAEGRITSHISGFFYKILTFLKNNVKPVFVIEGKHPEQKQLTLEKRNENREKTREQALEALNTGDVKKYNKYMARLETIEPYMLDDLKELVEAFGLPFIQAKSEGEAQLAYMSQKGDINVVATEDYDSIIFGSKTTARRLLRQRTVRRKEETVVLEPEMVKIDDILNYYNLEQAQLVDMAILIGTDFNKGVEKVGPVTALKYVKKYYDIETIMNNVEKVNNSIDIKEVNSIRDIFLHPVVETNYKIEFLKPNLKLVAQLMVKKHNFSFERVKSKFMELKNSLINMKSV